jgi:probable addiction module antidote protein
MFRKDPDFATAYLNHVLLEGGQEDLLLALRHMSQAFGGIASLANSTGLNPKTLYRTLSARGNPELRSLSALLRAMGMTLAVQPLERPASRPRTGVRRV